MIILYGNTEEILLKQSLQVSRISKEEKNNSINSISLDYTLKCIKQYKYVCTHIHTHMYIYAYMYPTTYC